jgi:ATP:corrinoid adenosyltransferase
MPHIEWDTEAVPKQALCRDDASLMQAWSEDGTALVRRRYQFVVTHEIQYVILILFQNIFNLFVIIF